MNPLKKIIDLLKPLYYLTFPNLCISCEVEDPLIGGRICLICLNELPIIEFAANARAAVIGSPAFPEGVKSVHGLYYFTKAGLVQKLLHQIKYQSRDDIALYLGTQFGKKLETQTGKEYLLVPVPLHKKKLHWRGFNQAQKIASGMAEVLGWKVETGLLERVRYEDSQATRSLQERMAVLDTTYVGKDLGLDTSQPIMIVDDVITTGATTKACYDQLRLLGFSEISVASLAITL